MSDSIPVYEKFTMSVSEAAMFYGIGEKKLRQICAEHPQETFYLLVGNKLLIKKSQFEAFLNRISST